MKKFDIVIIGPFARDKNVLLGRERFVSGGAVYYSAFPLIRMGLKVAVVAKLAKKDFPHLEELKKEGVAVFALPSQKTFGCKNIYPTPNLDKRISKLIAQCDSFELKEIPKIGGEIFQMGAVVAGDIPFEIIKELKKKGKIALDVQGFIRKPNKEGKLEYIDWQEKEKTLSLVDFLKLDKKETEFLTKEKDLKTGARELAKICSGEIVITSDPGVLVYDQKDFYFAPFTPKKILGRTGRGDTCFAAYLGKRLLRRSPKEACEFAGVVTSKKLESPGPFRGRLK